MEKNKAKPHLKRVEGFSLDSLSVDIETGKDYYDLDVKDVSTSVDAGVAVVPIEDLNQLNAFNLVGEADDQGKVVGINSHIMI